MSGDCRGGMPDASGRGKDEQGRGWRSFSPVRLAVHVAAVLLAAIVVVYFFNLLAPGDWCWLKGDDLTRIGHLADAVIIGAAAGWVFNVPCGRRQGVWALRRPALDLRQPATARRMQKYDRTVKHGRKCPDMTVRSDAPPGGNSSQDVRRVCWKTPADWAVEE